MNAVEIEEAVSDLAGAPFDPIAFPYAFLTAFGVKETTIARLRKGDTNASDVGGVLQRGNIHVAVAVPGGVNDTLRALRESPKTAIAKAKFILATDGQIVEAEDLVSGEPLACTYHEFADHFGFFLPLAGISTVKELKNNPIDVKATGRLNRLYVELLKENAEWGTPERRHDLNQFMARLIFCFFAEDTGIFNGTNLFTSTLERMSSTEAGSVEHVLTELFRAMDIAPEKRQAANLRPWADALPYVNGGLFSGGKPCPRFSKIARSYLLRAGELNWQEINPDIFGSMIQAVADDSERGSIGMHYTSVPNIMKVLGPLFLDDLHAQLEAAGDNVRKLRNLRKRLASIRVFDPACGSGNFLVIAYIRMREIEHEIVKLTDDEPKSMIPLANFYGIEIKDFAAEIARLALLIAEFQSDVRFINQHVAQSLVLPLKKTGQIKTGNALRVNWLDVCPPVGPVYEEQDLAGPTGRLALVHDGTIFQQEVETYICGNPPYRGSQQQSSEQKDDVSVAFDGISTNTKTLDYVCGWFAKATQCIDLLSARVAFVTTNSINQGRQVDVLWKPLFARGIRVFFANISFQWSNLASNNAGVTVSIVGIDNRKSSPCRLFDQSRDGVVVRDVANINGYLLSGPNIEVTPARNSMFGMPEMLFGNMPNDGGCLLLDQNEVLKAVADHNVDERFIRPFIGSYEFINGIQKYCIWVNQKDAEAASSNRFLADRFENVRRLRLNSNREATRSLAATPYSFGEVRQVGDEVLIVVPRITSEKREYLPVGLVGKGSITSSQNFALHDAPLYTISLIASKIHRAWVSAVCGRLEMRFMYSNTLCWNTFPVPSLTDQNKKDLLECSQNILLNREAHFPMTMATLYDPETMPDNLRRAHEVNDEIVERIYIGRRFRNDTERLEKLFDLYAKIVDSKSKIDSGKKPVLRGRGRTAVGVA